MPGKKFLFCINENITESKSWYDSGGIDHEGFRDSLSLELIYDYLFFIYCLDINQITKLNPDECIELYKKICLEDRIKNTFDLIIDVGAHHGHFTLNFADIAKNVISIEAFKSNFDVLQKNIEINKIENVRCLNNFVSSDNKSLVFDNKDWIRFNNDTIHKGGAFCIESIKLDNFYNEITNNTLIKIDAEGEEIQILKGSTKVITDKIPNFIIELHDFSTDNHDELTNLIDFSKYEIVKLNRQDAQLRKYHTGDKFSNINWLFFRKK